MSPRDSMKRLDKLQGWITRLTALADEMDADQAEGVQAMSDHLDCINDELLFQQSLILDNGPVVAFRNGTCVARYAKDD